MCCGVKVVMDMYTHLPAYTPVLTNVCILTPDTVGRITCVTVGGTTWEHGGGAATLPNATVLGEGVCQNVLKELRGCCVHSAHALTVLTMLYMCS